MANINNLVIGDNYIKYYDEILKISNISRTWIFKYLNLDKKKHEEEKRVYQNDKTWYEEKEEQKKRKSIKNHLTVAVVLLVLLLFAFSLEMMEVVGIDLFLIIIFVFKAFLIYKKEVIYPYLPPVDKNFPDKFGLGIEMNSGYKVAFTVTGVEGLEALRKLQNDIEDADLHKGIIYFNLNDYNISVENNDGIINTGNYANNISQRRQDKL